MLLYICYYRLYWPTSHGILRPRRQEGYPESKIHGANMGPIWGRQGPGGPHVGHMSFVIWEINAKQVQDLHGIKLLSHRECLTKLQSYGQIVVNSNRSDIHVLLCHGISIRSWMLTNYLEGVSPLLLVTVAFSNMYIMKNTKCRDWY